jgi:AsmA protein
MVKIGKILIWVIGAGLLVMVGLLVLAKVLISPERVRQTLLPLAEKALHRPVKIEEIEVKWFSGITINKLVVQEPDGGENFVAARSVQLRYQLLPLLSGRVVVDEIRLVGPSIRIVRQADGRYNFSDLLDDKGEGQGAAETTAPDLTPAEKRAFNLLVSKVAIEGGTLDFHDATLDPAAPYLYQISSLTIEASDISLTRPFPVELQASLNAAPLIFMGQVDLAQQTGGGKLTLNGLDVARLSPYFRDKIPGELESLLLSLDLDLTAGVKGGESRGRVILDKLSLNLQALPEAPLRNVKAVLDYAVTADLEQGLVSLSSLRLNYNDVLFPELMGNLTDLKGKPTFDGALTLPATELKPLLAALPAGLVKSVTALNPTGRVGAKLHLAGPLSAGKALVQNGEVKLDGVQVETGGLAPVLTGGLQLKGDTLMAKDLQLQAGDNAASIDFAAGNLFGKPITLSSQIRSQRFLLDPLLKTGAAPAAADGDGSAPAEQAGAELGPFDLPLSADGTVRIAQTTYKGLAMEDFQLDYRLENNILTLSKMTGRTAGGVFEQTSRIDLGKPGLAYDSQVSIRALQAEAFLKAFAPTMAGKVFGALSFETRLSGAGTQPDSLKRNLSASGNLQLSDGRLTGAGLVAELAGFLNLPELQEIRFKEGKGNFTIKQGKVNLNGELSGQDLRMAPKGTLGLDGALDLRLDAGLAPALTAKLDRKGNVSQFLTDKEGWGQLPLLVTGTASAPKFAFDASAVKGKLKERAVEEVQKKLQQKVFDKLLPGKKEAAPGEPAPAQAPLKETLKGLFGK